MTDASRKPFLFDQSFDPSVLRKKEEKDAAPVFSEADVAAARQAGREEGRTEGRQAALQDIAQKQAAVLQNIEGLLSNLARDVWSVYDQQKHAACGIALTVARKILPETARKNALSEINAAIESSIAEMINEPRLVLRVHDSLFDNIGAPLGDITSRLGFAGKIIVLADNALGEQDCRLEWADGGMERNVGLVWSEAERQIIRHDGQVPLPAPPVAPAPEEAPSSTTDIAV